MYPAIRVAPCPECKEDVQVTRKIGHRQYAPPRPCDLTICVNCLAFLIFNEDLSLRLMTCEEIGNLSDDCRMGLVRLREMGRQYQNAS